MDTKAHIQGATNLIVCERQNGLSKIVDLYNTWASWLIYASIIDRTHMRYLGTRGDTIMSDTRKLGEYILKYINNGYEPTIAMILFMEDIKCEKGGRFDIGAYKEPKGWYIDGIKHSIHLEHAFTKMSELFKIQGMIEMCRQVGINGSLYVY